MAPDPKTMLVVNPHAGKGRGARILPAVRARLEPRFPGLALRVSARPGQALDFGREALAEGYGRVVCLGGDGTPFEVVSGMFAAGAPAPGFELGLVPAGTGNSFLRDFSLRGWGAAVSAILAGRRRPVDVVEAAYDDNGREARRHFLNILGVGLIADILKLTNERLKGLGAAGYSLAVMLRLIRGVRNRLRLTLDGEELEIADSALVVSNSKFTGGAMKIAPMADSGDGRADLVAFQGASRRDMLAIFARIFSGGHLMHPRVWSRPLAGMAVTADPPQRLMADGELLGRTPLRLRVLPGALTVLA
ncbi:MAG TPA: diacylglycerol kinase family lipid kinase [Candidatus Aminicenantes bacterium]|nr:diacylglycerol kinase family lipid kinase [Candidatus Aminicenantes bacterium]